MALRAHGALGSRLLAEPCGLRVPVAIGIGTCCRGASGNCASGGDASGSGPGADVTGSVLGVRDTVCRAAPGLGTGLRTGPRGCGVGLRSALGRTSGVLHSGIVIVAVLAASVCACDALFDRAVLERLTLGLPLDPVAAGGRADAAGIAPSRLVGIVLGAGGVCSMPFGRAAFLIGGGLRATTFRGSVLRATAAGATGLHVLTAPLIVLSGVAVVGTGAITIIAAVVRRGGSGTCADPRRSGDARSSGRGPAPVRARVTAAVVVRAIVPGIAHVSTVGRRTVAGRLGRAITVGRRGRTIRRVGVPAHGFVAAGLGHRLLGGAGSALTVRPGGGARGSPTSSPCGGATSDTACGAGSGCGVVTPGVGIRSIGVETIGLGETLIHSAAILFDGGTLRVRIGPTTLGGDLLLLRSLGLLLGVEPSTIGLELALLGLQIALLNRLFLLLRLFTQLGCASTILVLLLRLAAFGRQRAQHDQDDQNDQDQHDDPDECG